MRAELGISESGLDAADPRRLRAARPDRLLHRRRGQGGDGAQRCARGSTAWEAAGTIHGEIQQAFVRAEVVGWDDLVEAGGYAAARDRGLLRTEGRDYVVADGDVITIKVVASPGADQLVEQLAPRFETVTWIAPGSTA